MVKFLSRTFYTLMTGKMFRSRRYSPAIRVNTIDVHHRRMSLSLANDTWANELRHIELVFVLGVTITPLGRLGGAMLGVKSALT
jgi:hypothetical protein